MAGPTINQHGDVISSALSVEPHEDARHQFFSETKVLRGQIQKIYAVDSAGNDPGNSKGSYTLYDVLVWKPDGSTEVVRRCRALQPFFGGTYNNFLEVLPTDPGPNATNQDLGSSERPGTHVLVGFIGGQKLYGPVILGALPHPNAVAIARRPSEDLGIYMEGEFQGLNFKVQNDGSFTLTFNGPRDDEGNLLNQNGPTTFSIDTQGNINLSTNNQQTVSVDRVNGVIDVVNGTTEIKMEQNPAQITINADNVIANVAKDMSATVGGKTTVKSTSDVTISSSSVINLQKGDAAPSEPFVLGNKFKSFMKDLLQAISQITHLGNLGAPTPPPVNAAQFTQLQSKLDDLLSELIKGTK
jgi:hypothetical protein